MFLRYLLTLILFCATSHAWARDQVWLIGGGPHLDASEAQIEQNVLWVKEVVEQLPGVRDLHVLFADGASPEADVLEWRAPAEDALSMQPLARVYDTYRINGERYRNHAIAGVEGSTEVGFLSRRLQRARGELSESEQLWLVFNGHGGQGGTAADNYLSLWEQTDMSVQELEQLLSSGPRSAPTRFVLTQCYAGGFAQLVYRNADPRQGLSDYPRCGFLAVAAEQAAEGCSPALATADYRDYSTYFFAALYGRSRTGTPLQAEPDRDGDGQVNPYEAHLYALRTARSTDLPRSTSEDYLLRWAPWYVDWLPVAEGSTLYASLAQELAAALKIGDAAELAARREPLHLQIGRLRTEQRARRKSATALRESIQWELEARWPAARFGHTLAFRQFLEQDLAAAQAFILAHPDYPELVAAQDGYWALVDAELELERSQAQLDRIAHLRRLDYLSRAFGRWAGVGQQADYARLLDCEQAPW